MTTSIFNRNNMTLRSAPFNRFRSAPRKWSRISHSKRIALTKIYRIVAIFPLQTNSSRPHLPRQACRSPPRHKHPKKTKTVRQNCRTSNIESSHANTPSTSKTISKYQNIIYKQPQFNQTPLASSALTKLWHHPPRNTDRAVKWCTQ